MHEVMRKVKICLDGNTGTLWMFRFCMIRWGKTNATVGSADPAHSKISAPMSPKDYISVLIQPWKLRQTGKLAHKNHNLCILQDQLHILYLPHWSLLEDIQLHKHRTKYNHLKLHEPFGFPTNYLMNIQFINKKIQATLNTTILSYWLYIKVRLGAKTPNYFEDKKLGVLYKKGYKKERGLLDRIYFRWVTKRKSKPA